MVRVGGLTAIAALMFGPAASAQAMPVHRAVVGTHYAKIVPGCAVPARGHAGCFVLRRVPAAATTAGARAYSVRASYAVGPKGGYTPSDLWSAYSLGNLASLTATGGPGSTQTVAVVDAYDDPKIEADLATFDANYGLPACTTANGCFKKVNEQGNASPLPAAAGSVAGSSGWDTEISLDVEAVHSACPLCKIVLVEANSSSDTDLGAAENQAATQGATEITNSFGGGENSDTAFQAAFNQANIVVTASSGDQGYYNWTNPNLPTKANEPAAYPGVIAVGGTSLQLNGDGTRASESVWNDQASLGQGGAGGGGCSSLFAAQTWQRSVANYAAAGCGTNRLVGDISALGDPLTGFDLYDSYSGPGWQTVGERASARR